MTPAEVIDLLEDVWNYLDKHADVDDGEDGQPVANTAMALQLRVTEAIADVQSAEDRRNGEH